MKRGGLVVAGKSDNRKKWDHRLKMELDLKSLIWAPCALLYSLAETPAPPPPLPAFGFIYEGGIGQPR